MIAFDTQTVTKKILVNWTENQFAVLLMEKDVERQEAIGAKPPLKDFRPCLKKNLPLYKTLHTHKTKLFRQRILLPIFAISFL